MKKTVIVSSCLALVIGTAFAAPTPAKKARTAGPRPAEINALNEKVRAKAARRAQQEEAAKESGKIDVEQAKKDILNFAQKNKKEIQRLVQANNKFSQQERNELLTQLKTIFSVQD